MSDRQEQLLFQATLFNGETMTVNIVNRTFYSLFVSLLLLTPGDCRGLEKPAVTFKQQKDKLVIQIGGKPFAEYVFRDPQLARPHFSNIYTPAGIKVTRNHPIEKGDQQDHPHHTGIFFTFGDLNGHDFWHGKGITKHLNFIVQPESRPGTGFFVVRNLYSSPDGKTPYCAGTCHYTIDVVPQGYRLTMETRISWDKGEFSIGSKEEGGLAARVATALNVENGGTMIDSEGRSGGKAIWGQQADWVDYGGLLQGKHVGLTIMAHPSNFSRCWWHARDYGLMGANPFGPLNQKGLRKVIKPGKSLHLSYAVLIHSHDQKGQYQPAKAYRDYAGPPR